ncbi:MAG: hypothetical protein EAZ97_01165, partial [Bacteroidetes bacterium]
MKANFLKNMKISILVCIFLLGFSANKIFAQKGSSFKGASWYVSEVNTLGANPVKQTFKMGEQVVTVSDKDDYELKNFLGVKSQKGKVIENDKIMLLSNEDKGYFAVFQIVKKTATDVTIRYIPYIPSNSSMEITFKNMKKPETKLSPTAFTGKWDYNGKAVIELLQNGKELFGTYCPDKTCAERFVLAGKIEEDFAIFSLLKDAKVIATVKVKSISATKVSWEVLTDITQKMA